MVLFRKEKDGDILYFYLRNNRINLKERGEMPLAGKAQGKSSKAIRRLSRWIRAEG
jgi:hypothetical protein